MILLIGKTCSGKSTLQNAISKSKPIIKKIVTYTTRPPRPSELNGIDYNFLTQCEFDNLNAQYGFVDYYQSKNGWCYGSILKEDSFQNSLNKGSLYRKYLNTSIVLTPSSLLINKQLFNSFVVFLHLDEPHLSERLIRRGDDFNELKRRLKQDELDFDLTSIYLKGIDLTINTAAYKIDHIAEIVFDKYQTFIKHD